ncbi:hypothetical protein SK128_005847 [Halocaridina rubra]|uniref:Chitin-binding type-2 domain-containing protein n=1 Tax=Halocaridina rubra TaxID=373956 RepID=A0AAN8XJ52_HALRR
MCDEIECPLRSPHLSCGDGYSFDMEIQECAPVPRETELCPPPKPILPVLNCRGVPGTCTVYEVCKPERANMTMCTEVECPLRQPNLNCGPGYSFHIETQKCATIPQETELCLPSTPPPPVSKCRGVPGTCTVYEVCKPEKANMTMCTEVECPYRQPYLSCGTGFSFHIETQKCAIIPQETELCPPPKPILPVLNCRGVPGTCTVYEVCKPGRANITMCTEVECPLRQPNLNCGPGYSFHIETQKCAIIPQETELCPPPKPTLPVWYCRGVPGTCTVYEVCKPERANMTMCTEVECPLRQPNLSCGSGYSFHIETQKCAIIPQETELCPPPEPPLPAWYCRGVPGTCTVYEVCKPERANMTMCTEVECPLRQPNLSCGPGYSFHIETQKCATIPQDSDQCHSLNGFPCEGVPGTCQVLEICNPRRTSMTLCKEIRCPIRGPNLSCGEGYLFDTDAQKCVKPPALPELCSDSDNITINEVDLLPCEYNGHIPETDYVKRRFCDKIPLCEGNRFLSAPELCEGYFECIRRPDGSYTAEERSCPLGLLYSFKNKICERSPSAEERCQFF